MSSAKITLLGLYHFLQYDNIDLFSNMILPEGIDKDTLVANILQKGSEFEVIYPDAEYLQNSIKYWSQKWYWSFDKWVKLINTKYDPLYNYDRTEHWVDDNVHEDEHTTDTTRNRSDASHVTGSQTDNASGTAEVETTKSAFDSSSYQPYDKVTTNTTDTDQVNNQTDGTSTSDETYNEGFQTDGTYKTTHDGRMFGNIGVMSSQDMFNQEIEVAYFNLYDRITEIFLNEYTIPIYV